MKQFKIENFIKGWFIGNFDPSIIKTNDVEVALKEYLEGDREEEHHHKIATEITVVVSGKIRMGNNVYCEGDIVVLEPNEATDFEALCDSKCLVVKYPGANNDKYTKGE